jgi:hypothetical protein
MPRQKSNLNKAPKWVMEALPNIQSFLPLPFLGVDSDNDSACINRPLFSWRDSRRGQP